MKYLNWIFLLPLVLVVHSLPCQPGQFVWTDPNPEGRLQSAYFRLELDLKASVDEASFYLFADSRYHLLINGTFVQFGPARFYPEHPQYDSFDLRPYLRKGKNVIGVKVLSNGVSTFQLRVNQPGFIAWGTIKTASGQSVDLATPGNWKAYKVQGYDENAARMTFALGPMEIYDARKDRLVAGWESIDFDASTWPGAQILAKQDTWGKLIPRTIPPLSNAVFAPRQLLGVYNWQDEEDLYSFEVLKPDKSREEFRVSSPFLGYTYIYSPRAQTVDAGIWWGEHFLNGVGPLPQETAGADRPHRQQCRLELKPGWNYFFVRRKTFFGKWAFMLALPKEAELRLSPEKRLHDPVFFKTAGPVAEEEWTEALDFRENPEAALNRYNWTVHTLEDWSGNPAIEMAWRYFMDTIPLDDWQRQEFTLKETSGQSVVYDFRYKKLARIIIDYEAPEGTVFDVGMTEDLVGTQANVMKRSGLYMATRHIAAGGKGRLETFKPYGFRYLQINIQNNDAPVAIKKVQAIQHVYPFEQSGSFACSDPVFNSIWAMGWRTLQVCAEDSYTDTPFRERGLYAGDMLPQMGVTLTGSNDLQLIKRSLELFQDMYRELFRPGVPRHPDEIELLEDYPLLTMEALKWYYDRTGDQAFTSSVFPAYEHLLNTIWERRDERGLIFNQRVFIEWTQIQKREIYNTAYHAILARSLMLAAGLAQDLGYPEKAGIFQRRYLELADNIRKYFWNEALGRFSDGIKDGVKIDHYYPISSVWPYLAGITDSAMNARIFPYIAEVLKNIGTISRQKESTPYGGFYVLAALYQEGESEVAERYIRQYWSQMVLRHEDTAWENFDDTGIGTLSHAWSAGPAYHLTTQVLGIPLGWPQFSDPDQLLISPQSASLEWAEGTIPHPRGIVKVKWEIRGPLLWVECEVPDGVKWEVRPRGRLAKLNLWVNGKQQ